MSRWADHNTTAVNVHCKRYAYAQQYQCATLLPVSVQTGQSMTSKKQHTGASHNQPVPIAYLVALLHALTHALIGALARAPVHSRALKRALMQSLTDAITYQCLTPQSLSQTTRLSQGVSQGVTVVNVQWQRPVNHVGNWRRHRELVRRPGDHEPGVAAAQGFRKGSPTDGGFPGACHQLRGE